MLSNFQQGGHARSVVIRTMVYLAFLLGKRQRLALDPFAQMIDVRTYTEVTAIDRENKGAEFRIRLPSVTERTPS